MTSKKKQNSNRSVEELEEDKLDLLDKCNQIFAKIRQDFNMKFPTDQYIKFDRQYANHMKKEFDLFSLCVEEVSQTYDIDGEKILSSFLNNVLITIKVMLFTQLRCFLNYLDQNIQFNDSKPLKNWEVTEIQKLSRHRVKITRGTVDEDIIRAQERNLVNDPSDDIKKRLGIDLDPLLREHSMTKQELVQTLEEKRKNLTLKESKAGRYLYRQIEGIKQTVQKEKAFVTDFEEKHLQAIKKLVFSDGVTQVKGILDQITDNLDSNAKKRLIKVLEYLFSNAKDLFAKKNVSCQTMIVGQTIDGYENQITKLNRKIYDSDRHIDQVLKDTLQKDSKITELEKQIAFLKHTATKEIKSDDPQLFFMQKIDEQNKQIEKLNNSIISLNVDKQYLQNQIQLLKNEQNVVAVPQDKNKSSPKKGNNASAKGNNNATVKGKNNKNNDERKKIVETKNQSQSELNQQSSSKFDLNEIEQETNQDQQDEENNNNAYTMKSSQMINTNNNIQSPSSANYFSKNSNAINSPNNYGLNIKLQSKESETNKEVVSKNINTQVSSNESYKAKDSNIKSTYQTEIMTSPSKNNVQSFSEVKAPEQHIINSSVGNNQNSHFNANITNKGETMTSQQNQQNESQNLKINKNSIHQSSTNISNNTKATTNNNHSSSIHESSLNKHNQIENNTLNYISNNPSSINSSNNINILQDEAQPQDKKNLSKNTSKSSLSKNQSIHIQAGGSKKVLSHNNISSQSELQHQDQEVKSLAMLSNQQIEMKMLDHNQQISQGNANNNTNNNTNNSNNLANNSKTGSHQELNNQHNQTKSKSKSKVKSQVVFSQVSKSQQTKEFVDQNVQFPSNVLIKSEQDINSQILLEHIQNPNQKGFADKQNNIQRGSNITGLSLTQNSLLPTKDTDLMSQNTILQNHEGIDDNGYNQHEISRSKIDLNDILYAFDLNQEEEEKKQSTKILEVLTNKDNPKRREIINSIVNILNQNSSLSTPKSIEDKQEVQDAKKNEKIDTYNGFSSDQGQTQYKKTQTSLTSTPYSTHQNMINNRNQSDSKNSELSQNQLSNKKFIEGNNNDKKYFKSKNSSQTDIGKSLEFKNGTLEKIDQNLNESSLNTSTQGRYPNNYSVSQSQTDLFIDGKQKKYATQVTFKDLQVKPAQEDHLERIVQKQEIIQDVIRKKNQIAMSRFQGTDSNAVSYRDSSLNNNQIQKNQQQQYRNLSNVDNKRGQFQNTWKGKDEFRLHDTKQSLQYLPNANHSQSTHNVAFDQPRKNITKFTPLNQKPQIKQSIPFNEDEKFTKDLYAHLQQGKIDFTKLKDLDMTGQKVKSQTNLYTHDSSSSQNHPQSTGQIENNIGFNEFHEYYAQVLQQHKKCGPMCIHLKRFYEKLDFNIKQYEKRQFIICPTLVVQEIPKDNKRETSKFNLQNNTMYAQSCTKL